MRKITYYISQLILFVAFGISCFAIVNTMVRIKYEADDGCFSSITSENLCLQKAMWMALCVITVSLMIVLGYYNTKNAKKK